MKKYLSVLLLILCLGCGKSDTIDVVDKIYAKAKYADGSSKWIKVDVLFKDGDIWFVSYKSIFQFKTQYIDITQLEWKHREND